MQLSPLLRKCCTWNLNVPGSARNARFYDLAGSITRYRTRNPALVDSLQRLSELLYRLGELVNDSLEVGTKSRMSKTFQSPCGGLTQSSSIRATGYPSKYGR